MAPNPLSTARPWDLVTEGYVTELIPVFQKWAKDSLAPLCLTATDTLIDIACGPGTVSLLAAPAVHSVVALDFSAPMIAAFEKEIQQQNIPNITTGICDCQALPFDDARFDAAVSQFGLMFFPDRNKGFSEIFRVLKPAGRVSIASWAPISQSEAMTLMLDAITAGFSPYLPPADENRNIVKGLDDKNTFYAELQAAGFTNIEIKEVAHSFTAKTPVTFWNSMAASSAPIALIRAGITQSQWLEAEKLAIELITSRLHGKSKLYSTAYIASARKPG